MQSATVRSYVNLYEAASRPLLYATPWWLDATCGASNWDAVIKNSEDGQVVAAIPFHSTKIRGLSAVITPPLTQWVSLIASTDDPGISNQSLLNSLPKSSILDLCVRPENELLHQGADLPIILKYSFIIPGMDSMESIRKGYNEGLKRNLRQAEKNYTIETSDEIAGFLSLCEQSYFQRNMKPPKWLDEVVRNVYKQLSLHHCGSITVAKVQGKVIAAVLTAWDQYSAYYLAGGRTADDQGASAHALLLDHAVQAAQSNGIAFDFEGSMHPGIANFFQSFGGSPVAYWQLRRFNGLGKLWSLFH